MRAEAVCALLVERAASSEPPPAAAAAAASLGGLALGCVVVAQDGRSASLTAPSAGAQSALLGTALARGAVRALALVEAHGSGTALGDPVEVAALLATVPQGGGGGSGGGWNGGSGGGIGGGSIALGGAKASLGHAEAAAGHVGLLRAAAQLCGASVEGNARLRVLNPHVVQRQRDVIRGDGGGGGGGSMLAVSTQRCPAAAAAAVVAAGGTGAAAAVTVACGVSSFGFSGTIAHALLLREAHTAHTAAPPLPPPSRRAGCIFRRRHFSWSAGGEGASTGGAGGALGTSAGVGGAGAADAACAGAGAAGAPPPLLASQPPTEIRSAARSPAEVRAELAALVGGLMVGGGAALGGAGGGTTPLEAHGLDSLDLLTVRARLDSPRLEDAAPPLRWET